MTVDELVQFVKDISEYKEFDGRHYCQQCFKEVQNKLFQQHAEIEALKKYFEAWKFLNNGMICLGTNARAILKKAQEK